MNIGQSYTIGTLAKIPVRIHWTFLLIIPFIVFNTKEGGFAFDNVLWFTIYVLSIFTSVILHEYGHALTARRYGVNTKDIIISPIGGVARLESFPEKPLAEFVITIMGPLVNVAIAIVIGMYIFAFGGREFLPLSDDMSQINNGLEFLRFAFMTNIALFVFNLIPAFPMDGGRILRSLSSMVFDRKKSTRIAAIVGRVIAVGFVGLGVYLGSMTMPLIGVFIFMSAGKELEQLNVEQKINNTSLNDIMRASYTKLHIGDTLQQAIDLYKKGDEKNFLVFDSLGYVSGALPELYILKAIENGDTDRRLGQYLSQSQGRIDVHSSLIDVFKYLQDKGVTIAEVTDNDTVIGVIDRNMISEAIKINAK